MAWFKVDDGFWSHPKVMLLSDSAVALWVKAGTYSCQHLTDGHIPTQLLRFLGTEGAAQELVESGLWNDDEQGFRFHDWDDYQETSDAVKQRREQARERQRKRRAMRDKPRDTSNGHADVTRDSRVSSQKVSTPDPTRPDPTLKDKDIDQTSGSTQTAERFDEFWSLVPRKVGKDKARPAYAKAVKRAGDEQVVIDGMRRLSQDPNLPDPKGPEARFIAHPTTWLNEGRWNDDPLPPRSKPPEQQTSWGSDPRHWLPQEAPQPTGPDYASGHVVIDDDRPF